MFWATLVLASVFSFVISLICLHYRFSVNPSVAAAVIFYTTQVGNVYHVSKFYASNTTLFLI